MHMVKDELISPQVWQTRISSRILMFRFSLHMVKDDWTHWDMTDQDPTQNFNSSELALHMVKDDRWPHGYDRWRIST